MTTDPTIQPDAVTAAEKDFIHDRLWGFADIKILQVSIDLKLVDALGKKPMNEEELAAAVGITRRSVTYLLIALGSMGFLAYENGKYKPSAMGQKFLVESSPFYYGQAIRY